MRVRPRQPAQPCGCAHHAATRARGAGRTESDGGQACQGFDGLRSRARLPDDRCGAARRRRVATAASVVVRAGTRAGRMRIVDRRTGGRERSARCTIGACDRHRRAGCCGLFAHGCLHGAGPQRHRHRSGARLPAGRGHPLARESNRRRSPCRISGNRPFARGALDRSARRVASHDEPGGALDRGGPRQGADAGNIHRYQSRVDIDLQGGQPESRARQLRRFVFRLRDARAHRGPALRRFRGGFPFRATRLRSRRAARAGALRGEHVPRFRHRRGALDEACARKRPLAVPRVRYGQSGRRPALRVICLQQPQLAIALCGYAAA